MRIVNAFFCCVLLLISFGVHANVSTLVADTKSGLILSSKNAIVPQYPASLTKVMTLYLTFNALENGLLKMDDKLPVTAKAARQPRSKLYVKAGQTIRVRDAIMALIIISANDVAVVLAEALAPTEDIFAKMMTNMARDLGLKNTTFKNASGLHHPEQVTTAQDMAVLTMAIIKHFPQYYKLFAKETFKYGGKVYKTHNHVKKKYAGAEGLKTGYISTVGYNIISTAKRNNHRLVSVVIGQNTIASRDRQAMNLLDRGFSKIKKQAKLFQRLKKNPKQSALNKIAVLMQPDMTPYLKIMAQRLDQTVKSGTNRRALLALSPHKTTPRETSVKSFKNKVESESSITPNKENETGEGMGEVRLASLEKETILNDELSVPTNISAQGDLSVQIDEEKIGSPEAVGNIAVVSEAVMDGMTKQMESKGTDMDSKTVLSEDSQKIVDISLENKRVPEKKIYVSTFEKKNTNEKNGESKELDIIRKIVVGGKNYPIVEEKDIGYSWGVQVGAFSSVQAAQKAAQKALAILAAENKVIYIPQTKDFFRSRIFGFNNHRDAKKACRKLKSRKMQCMPLPPIS